MTPPAGASNGFTLRAFVIALILTVLCGFWVRQSEIVILATQVTESVPPVPAVAVLLALVAVNPLAFRLGRRLGLTRPEILCIYSFVAIAISMLGPGALRFWLNLIASPFYLATPENHVAEVEKYIPSWLAVKSPTLIKELYEGSPSRAVPWGAWLIPLLAWAAFLMALWFCMLCMMRLVQKRWLEAERLSFPIVKLPLETTAETGGQRPFLKDPVMWAGFALAAAYNFDNILNAFFPTIPCPGKMFDLNPLLNTPPWDSLQPLQLQYRPDLIGFGILVPSEILFSIWFFYVVGRLEALGGHFMAWDFPGMPFQQEQSMGAFLLLGAALLWQVRSDLASPILDAWRHRRLRGGSGEPPLWAAAGLLLSFLFLCGFCRAAGMALWVAAAFLGIVLVTALVCARIRAEAGIPLIWLFPYYQQKKILLYTLGTSAFLTGGLPGTLTIFAMLTFLSRGYFPALIGYQIESLKIGEEIRMSRGRMCVLILAAAAVGIALAYYILLSTYYQHGAQHLGGMWGWDMPLDEYGAAATAPTTPVAPDTFRTCASALGAVVALVLVLLRRTFVGFPLHPVGFAVATAYGSLVWWSFLLVWIFKGAILRWGGMRLYRRAVPGFLGFALGHFFAAGVVWGLLGAFWPDAAREYAVWFG